MRRTRLVGLLKLELRDSRTLRLCDGGWVPWDAEKFTSRDATFGILGALESFEEGVSDEVPAFSLTFLPASTAAAAELSAPGMQGSRLRLWTAELDDLTGQIVGTPDQQFDGMLDQATLATGLRKRELRITIVPRGERFFNANDGNTLSDTFHKSVYPGERGEENATDSVSVAWGTEAAPGTNIGASSLTGLGGAFVNILNRPRFDYV
ncbi:hypothetical protein [Sphingobium yanoikuyae]|uniref:hypothetical protein n=1 Tax=Sphingobium yanoikuyae TaxID=13690 RepID=UPI0022DDF357|nr:hypothetical protein [Sphingobium yanoikuyae]WBQ17465.1 hypothetical protein PAE53_04470 [Sphingobium yanoikuyae]